MIVNLKSTIKRDPIIEINIKSDAIINKIFLLHTTLSIYTVNRLKKNSCLVLKRTVFWIQLIFK